MACGAVRKTGSRGNDASVSAMRRGGLEQDEIKTEIILRGTIIPVSWFVPRHTLARGWVFLQHGFARTREHLKGLAERLTDQGLVVVTPSLSTSQLNDTFLAEEMADEFIKNPPLPGGVSVPAGFVLAGHSIGGRFVSTMAGRFSRQLVLGFKGLLLLDAVEQNDEISKQLGKLGGVGVMAILAQPGVCNMLSNVTRVLDRVRRGNNFVGLRLKGGTHCDAEGGTTDALCTMTCGKPQRENISVVRDFTTHWIVGFITGQRDESYFPGGEAFERLLTATGATRL